MTSVAVGIDLGTTNSCVAVYRNDRVEIIPNEQDSCVIPSWVSFTDDGILTGHEAKDEAHNYVRNTVFEVKRLIGQRFSDELTQRDVQRLPYQVVEKDGLVKVRVQYQGKEADYYPEEISAFVLQKLKNLAEAYLQKEVTNVVVTIPAYFNEFQREATILAATLAGFKKVNIINEPTAAALAFSYADKKRYKRNVMIYDFGGGTFDVSIVTVGRGKCEVKGTKGDLHLGGIDIDLNLVEYIKRDFEQQHGEKINESEAEIRRLKNSCEKIKKRLSGNRVSVGIELLNLSGKDYISSITREAFEDLNAEIFQKTLAIVKDCLESSGLAKEQIDEAVLVGGSSRIPKVQEMLKEFFGEDRVNKGVNPDEAVAYGAAIHATNLLGNKLEVLDVISLSLGIAEQGIYSSVIIPCNTSIPTEFTKRYQTAHDNQESACILVFQGEDALVENNFELGKFTLTGLRRAAAGSVEIDVCFRIDFEGMLSVTASEVGADNESSIQIDVKRQGLTPAEIQFKVGQMEQLREEEQRRKRFYEERYGLELLHTKACIQAVNMEDEDAKRELHDKCAEISEWLKNLSVNDYDELVEKKRELESLCR